MQIIDAHAHILNIPDYLSLLLKAMDTCGIEKACISGIGPSFHSVGNLEIEKIIKQVPNRFIGSYFIRPGWTHPQEIEEAYAHGFKMLKVTLTTKPYNDPSLFPLWEVAERLHMPILFHTGILTIFNPDKPMRFSSWDMHPMRLEPIANAFPKLNLIIAHLGVHWNHDAAELARMRKNIYVDLTGEPNGWRARADAQGMETYLWWPNAFEKVIFGTDVIPSKITEILHVDQARYQRLGLSYQTQEKIFGRTILHLLGENR